MLRLLAVLALWSVLAGPAAAHAVLLDTAPADGAALEHAPAEVTLTFNEPVTPVALTLLDAAGRRLTAGSDVGAHNTRLTLRLPPDLPNGGYVASYRVTSVDGHPVAGAILFTVGTEAALATMPDLEAGEAGWTVAAAALQALQIAANLVAIGGLLFRWLVHPLPRGRLIPAAALTAALAACAGLGVAAVRLTGSGGAGLLDPAVWRVGLASSRGPSAVLLGLALALACFGGRRSTPVAAVLAAASFMATGHAATASPAWLTAPALGLHSLCAAVWLGALAPLRALLRHDPAGAVDPVRRFSRLAGPALALLLLSGGTLAVVQLAAPDALLDTAYGRILLSKLAAVAGLLGLVLWNKRWLTPRLPGAAGALRGAILQEFGLFAGVLAATAALSETPPPRTLAELDAHAHHAEMATGITVAIVVGHRQALLTLEPERTGGNRLVATLTDAGGAAVEPIEVIAAMANPEAGVEPITRPLRRVAPGHWQADDCPLPLPGRWHIELKVLVTDFETTSLSTIIDIP